MKSLPKEIFSVALARLVLVSPMVRPGSIDTVSVIGLLIVAVGVGTWSAPFVRSVAVTPLSPVLGSVSSNCTEPLRSIVPDEIDADSRPSEMESVAAFSDASMLRSRWPPSLRNGVPRLVKSSPTAKLAAIVACALKFGGWTPG